LYVWILPFVEQSAAYSTLTSHDILGGAGYYESYSAGTPDPNVNTMLTSVYDFVLCPSDANSSQKGTTDISCTNYVYSCGDYAILSADFTNRNRGPFGIGKWLGLNAIHDGTSNTLLFSERVINQTGSRGIKESYAVAVTDVFPSSGPTAAGACETDFIPLLCLQTKEKNEYRSGTTVMDLGGRVWCDAATTHAWTNTILPPNAPTCISAWADDAPIINPPTSYHSGGVNVVRADASGGFISETVDAGILSTSGNNCTLSGESPFGVWGAFGSIGGGEGKGL
jgi:hypothetical protein